MLRRVHEACGPVDLLIGRGVGVADRGDLLGVNGDLRIETDGDGVVGLGAQGEEVADVHEHGVECEAAVRLRGQQDVAAHLLNDRVVTPVGQATAAPTEARRQILRAPHEPGDVRGGRDLGRVDGTQRRFDEGDDVVVRQGVDVGARLGLGEHDATDG